MEQLFRNGLMAQWLNGLMHGIASNTQHGRSVSTDSYRYRPYSGKQLAPTNGRGLACETGLSIIVILFLLPLITTAQTNRLIQEGNKLYDQKRYDEATNDYLKALQKDPNNATGMFNLGNALYQKQQYDSSRKIMSTTANAIKDKNGKAAVNYNIGNTYMSQKKWEDAVASYKNTLRNNPQDADAKYNLSYAEQMLKKDQKSGGGKNDKKDQNKDKKDQNKDKQQQDKDKKDQDKKDQQQQQDKDNKDKQDDQKPQGQPSKLSQQQADQLLNALQQEEKKLQDKLKKEKGIPVKLDKDW